jgi:predicted TIM-barrel fold metal-dependent hydrolase
MIESYCKASSRLKAVANVPANNPAEAAKELKRAVTKLGLCGGMLAAQAHSRNWIRMKQLGLESSVGHVLFSRKD